MSTAGLSPSAIVGIGAGIGTLFFCAASFILFQIFKSRREHHKELKEIEGASPVRHQQLTQLENSQGPCHLPFAPVYNPYIGWNTSSSNDAIHQLAPYGNVPGGFHLSFDYPEEWAKPTWHFSGRRPRIGRMSSKARRLQALSAIIESPKGTPNGGGSRNSPAGPPNARDKIHARPGAEEVPRIQLSSAPAPSPKLPPKSNLRPTLRVEIPVPSTKSDVKEVSRPRTGRSKSLGSGSDDNKPNSALITLPPGPAPTGPLPPLPPLPRNIQRQGRYNPANRHSALGIPASDHAESTSTSLSSSPERNWERISSTDNLHSSFDRQTHPPTSRKGEDSALAGAETGSTNTEDDSVQPVKRPQPLSIPNYKKTAARLSMASTSDKHTSWSSVAESLKRDSNRLSIPQIVTADRVSMSRVSSTNSLDSKANVHMVSTPKHRARLSKVSASGSPVPRSRPSAVRRVSDNVSTPCKTSMRTTFSLDTAPTTIQPPPSILKGSPGARKGARPPTCVRLSTLSPVFLEPGQASGNLSRSSSVYEHSPVRHSSPVADKHMNGDVTLRPRSAADVMKWRATLTSSPTPLPMPTYHQEPSPYDYGYHSRPTSSLSQRPISVTSQRPSSAMSQRPTSASSQRPGPSLSRQSSVRSISSLPSMSHFDGANYTTTPKPALTRQHSAESSTQERTPAFGLHVTPDKVTPLWQQPRSFRPTDWSRQDTLCT